MVHRHARLSLHFHSCVKTKFRERLAITWDNMGKDEVMLSLLKICG